MRTLRGKKLITLDGAFNNNNTVLPFATREIPITLTVFHQEFKQKKTTDSRLLLLTNRD